jgi:hypothetical protein
MTGMLQDLLHERADELGPPALDLAEITGTGDRRLRRRRTTLVGGLAAAAVVAALAVPAALAGGDDGPRRDLAADGTARDPQPLAWISGSTLHRPGRPDVDLGVDVRAWVWVGDDIAFTDDQHRVRLWTGDALDVVGRTRDVPPDKVELVSDGTFVGWVDAERGLTVHDVATGRATSVPVVPGHPARVTALDGRTVYGTDVRGTIAFTVSEPGVEVLEGDVGAVLDAEGGTLVRQVDDENKVVVTTSGRTVPLATREFANLSPDGRLVAVEDDDIGRVVDAVTGEERAFEHGHEWAVGYQWLDATTLAVLAFDGLEGDTAEQAWLLTCDGGTGECRGPGTEVPAGFGDFQLPIGVHFTQ